MKVPGAKTDLKAGLLQVEDLPACVPLISDTFGIDAQVINDWIDKRLLRNPWQEELRGSGVGIWNLDELIACRLATAQPWWVGGKQKIIAFAAHTCVKKRFRGKGLGLQLIEKSKDLADMTGSSSSGVGTQSHYLRSGYDSLGDDNAFYRARISFVGSLCKRLGNLGGQIAGTMLDPLFLNPRGLGRANKSFNLRRVRRCDRTFDLLWESARTGYGACLERTSEYLNWRLFDCPTYPLEIAGLYDSDDQLCGFGIWHETSFGQGVRMAVLRDFFTAINNHAARNALLAHLTVCWRQKKISWASLEVAHPGITANFQAMRFEHVPSIGGRYHVFSSRGLPAEIKANWLRSGLDGDYFDIVQAA